VVFKSALAAYLGGAEPARRGEAASSLFFLAYLGLIIPVLGIGISTQFVSSQTAMWYFAGVLLVILAAIATLAVGRQGVHRIAQAAHQRVLGTRSGGHSNLPSF
jgi:membrane protein YdbS with pleckstrin-like domain